MPYKGPKNVIPVPKKRPAAKEHRLPQVTRTQVRSSWFVGSNGQVYKTVDCHAIAFKQAIKAVWKPSQGDAMKLLRQRELDEDDRWFLLCYFPLPLFASKEEAEQSLTAKQ